MQSEMPRERMLRLGVHALKVEELLAIILGSGTKEMDVFTASAEILKRFGGLQKLLHASVEELQVFPGIGKVKAVKLKALFGIITSYMQEKTQILPNPLHPREIFIKEKLELAPLKSEKLFVLMRNAKGKIFQKLQVAEGSLTRVLTHPREIFSPLVRHSAYSFILMHNHPSGDPLPSKADHEVTKKILSVAQIMEIPLDDHIIIGNQGYFSFWENKLYLNRSAYAMA